MNWRKVLGGLSIVGILFVGEKYLIPINSFNEPIYAKSRITYNTNLYYTNHGDSSHFELDSVANRVFDSFGNVVTNRYARINIYGFDDNNDGQIDCIGIIRKHYDSYLGEKKVYGKESITFYRGPAHLEGILKQNSDHAKVEKKTISQQEIGVVTYDGLRNLDTFTPNNSGVIKKAFFNVDRIYDNVFPLVSNGIENTAEIDNTLLQIGKVYEKEIQELLSTPAKL